VGCLLITAPIASAGPVEDAAAALRTDSVYLHPAANRNVDVNAVRQAIGTEPIKIAIIPKIDSVSEVAALPRRLAADLPGNTVAVISGRYFYAGSEVICRGLAGRAAADAINANEAALDANNTADSPSDITKPLAEFVAQVKASPNCPEVGGRGDRYADQPGGGAATVAGPDDTAIVLPWVLAGAGVVVLAVGAWVMLTRRRTRDTAATRREQAVALVERLGDELAELGDMPAGGPGGQERADAAAHHGEATAILVGATTDVHFSAARHAAITGLTAARAARTALGRDPGPPLSQAQRVTEPEPAPISGEPPTAETDRR
jgi:hypothetical protein